MLFEAEVSIAGSKAAIWAAITNIESAADIIRGIDRIEILERPSTGLVGLRWRETRMFFGKPATVEKVITEAIENAFYTTRADGDGMIHVATTRIAESPNGCTLTSRHESTSNGLLARALSIPMGVLFKGIARKALLRDLNDIKFAVERI